VKFAAVELKQEGLKGRDTIALGAVQGKRYINN